MKELLFLPPPEDWVLRRLYWNRVFCCREVHNRDTMVSLERPSTTLLAGERNLGTGHHEAEKTFHFRTLGEKGSSAVERSRKQRMDPYASGSQPFVKCLDFVPLGKQRKEQSGDATEIEKNAMRSVLGALGCLARESRPDLSGLVSILQSRFNRAQVSDI